MTRRQGHRSQEPFVPIWERAPLTARGPAQARAGDIPVNAPGAWPDAIAPDLDTPTITVPDLDESNDASVAVRSASTLGSTLVVTAGVAFVVQLLAQGRLGTSDSGVVGGAESLSIILLGLLSLGVETYTLREVALRPAHARSFIPGVMAARAALTVVVVAVASTALAFTGRGRLGITMFVLFGLTRFLLQSNEILSSALKATGVVGPIPRINLVAKAIWAATILGGVFGGRGPLAVPVGWVVGEGWKFFALERQVRRRLGVRWTLRDQQVAAVVRASLPFTAGAVVSGWSGYFDTTLMSFQLPRDEIGLYRIAQTFSGVAMLLGTILPWVVMPLASRAYARSKEEYRAVMRASLQFVLTLSIPGSVLVALHADTLIGILGQQWRPAVPALRLLALAFPLTYLVILGMMLLQVQHRSWLCIRRGATVVGAGMIVNLAILRNGPTWFGHGGAGTLAALVVLGVETITAVWIWMPLGFDAFRGRTVRALASTLAATATVVVYDRLLSRVVPNPVRLAADIALFAVFLVSWGGVTLREARQVLSMYRSGDVS